MNDRTFSIIVAIKLMFEGLVECLEKEEEADNANV